MLPHELKELRHEHKLTQKAMGALLGYGANYIYRLETGKEKITHRFEKLVGSILGQKRAKKSS